MRLSHIRIVFGSLALGALIVYTTRLPEHSKAAEVVPPTVAAIVAAPPTAETTTLIAGPAIGAETQLPVVPAPRSHLIAN
jgi:hypothetical protein